MQRLDLKKMRTLREAKGLSQTAAAKGAGVAVSRWNDIESGRKPNVTIETLCQIAKVLAVDARELLTPNRSKKLD